MNTKLILGCLLSFGLTGAAHAGCPTPKKVWVPPKYRVVEKEVIIPAEYKTVQRTVWVEAVHEWRYRKVRVPVKKRGLHLGFKKGKFHLELNLGRKRKHGYYKAVREQVCVRPGHWSTVVERVLVRPQRVEIVQERVCVRNGYWREVVVCRDRPLASFHLTLLR